MSNLCVSLFGKFCVYSDEQALIGFKSHKVLELFSFLLLNRDSPQPRETLAGILWGDYPTAQSKKCLRQTLWQLQAILKFRAGPMHVPVLLVEPAWIMLNEGTDLWLDVAVFEQAFTLVQGVAGQEMDVQTAQAVQSAVQLYRGDLLEGWYQDWCLYERERLQNMYLAMLDKLMDYCEAHCNYESALVYGARILRYDRAREHTHQKMMHLYCLTGDRTTALRQYQRCITALDEELDVKPSRRTSLLYEQIRMDQMNGYPRKPLKPSRLPR